MADRAWLNELWERNYNGSYTYKSIDLNKERIRIPRFNYQDAFEIGILVRNFAKEEFPGNSVVIDISLRNGHSLFRIITGPDSMPDDDNWIKRNREISMRFGYSSYITGRKFQRRLTQSEVSYDYQESKKRRFFYGGALPIFIDSCEYPVACLTVSGLASSTNHWIAVESVWEYIRRINDAPGKDTGTD